MGKHVVRPFQLKSIGATAAAIQTDGNDLPRQYGVQCIGKRQARYETQRRR
jgi:hypothetical protein